MSVYRTPPNPTQMRAHECACRMAGGIRKGHWRLVEGIYGSGSERYAFICFICGDTWGMTPEKA